MKKASCYNIMSLLPYTEDSELINKAQKLNDLYFIKSVVDVALMALDGFIEENLTLFDAQIGENLCQIRAYKNLHLGLKYLTSHHSKEKIFTEIDRIKTYKKHLEDVIIQWEEAITHSFSYNKSLDGREYLGHFLDRHHLNLDLNEDAIFIITCFFLTHFSIRHDGLPIAINLNFISRELHISKYRSKRLTHKYQLLVCQLGCDFVLQIASDLSPAFGYQKMLSKLYQISDEDRAVLPCYLASEVILHHAISKKNPILFIINRVNRNGDIHDVIYFTLVGQGSEFNLILVPVNDYLSQHCLVVFGVMSINDDGNDSITSYIDLVLRETPLKLILANTASHPQYSGKCLEEFRVNPFLLITDEPEQNIKNIYEKKLLDLQHFATTKGCSKDNQTTFFLKHVYASTLANEINRLKKIHGNCVYDAHKIIDQ